MLIVITIDNVTLRPCSIKFFLIICDECNMLNHGDCPVLELLSELDPTAGYDQASLAYTQIPVLAQLMSGPRGIPGAELGAFAVSFSSIKVCGSDLMRAGNWPCKILGNFTTWPMHGR